jgi:hypothetical protein
MDKPVTLISFKNIQDLAILKGRLEADGIECFAADENAGTSNPFSTAIGGIKLQVRESDVERARAILIESGYLRKPERPQYDFFLWFEQKTNKLPFIKRLPIAKRFLWVAILLCSAIVAIIYFIAKPNLRKELRGNSWCVEEVVYKGTPLTVRTTGILVEATRDGRGFCAETMSYHEDGSVSFPGFNSEEVRGHWELNNNKLVITAGDSFGYIYEGSYKWDLTGRRLVLKSADTKIVAHECDIMLNF